MHPLIYNLLGFTKRNAGKILTVASVGGLVGTSVLSAKGATKVANALHDADVMDEKEEVKLYLKSYAPAATTGLFTTAAIIGIELLGERKAAALSAALTVAAENYRLYRQKNIELHGKEADDEVIEAVASTMLDNGYIGTGNGFGMDIDDIDYSDTDTEHLFYEPISGMHFKSTLGAVMDARYHLNRNFALRGYASVPEFLWLLGVGEEVDVYSVCPEEGEYGWDCSYLADMCENYWIDILVQAKQMTNGKPLYYIYYPVEPVTNYDGSCRP